MTRLAKALLRFALVLLGAVGATIRAGAIELAYFALMPALWAHSRHPAYFPKIMAANLAAIAAALVAAVWFAI